MNQSTLFKMWQIIISNNARQNMSGDFSGKELDSMVESIMNATAIEPVDVHHCIAMLDNGVVTELLVQQNGVIVSRIESGEM